MEKTLFVSDLDGTLLQNDATLSAFSESALNELLDRGLLFTFATARSIHSAAGITAGLRLALPVVTHNGALIVNHRDRKIVEACTMDKKKIAPILNEIAGRGLYPVVYALIEGRERFSWHIGSETSGIAAYLAGRESDTRRRPAADWDELFAGDIYYFTFIGGRDEMAALYPMLTANPHVFGVMQEDTYAKDEYWLELARFDARKDVAMRKVMHMAGASRCVAFGDNQNDVPMLAAAEEAYAVENAAPEAKEAAGAVIGSNTADSVARKIMAICKTDKSLCVAL